MQNEDVAIDFSKGLTDSKVKNMFIEDNVVYSYGYHFPIAIRLKDEGKGWGSYIYLFNQDGYSNSTSRHKNLVKRHITGEIKECHTEFLKLVISKNIKTIKELVAEFGLQVGQTS